MAEMKTSPHGFSERDFGGGRPQEASDEKVVRKFQGGSLRKRACRFCTDSDFVLDYKNVRIVQSFLSEHGKIVPRRISGNCAKHQRQLTSEIKRARNLALIGYSSPGV